MKIPSKKIEQLLFPNENIFVRAAFPQWSQFDEVFATDVDSNLAPKMIWSLHRIGPRTFCCDDSDKALLNLDYFFLFFSYAGAAKLRHDQEEVWPSD